MASQGLAASVIACRIGIDRKTAHNYIERGLAPPIYQVPQPRPAKMAPFHPCLRERVAACPDLTGNRLHREIRDLGYADGYTAVKDSRTTSGRLPYLSHLLDLPQQICWPVSAAQASHPVGAALHPAADCQPSRPLPAFASNVSFIS